MPSFQCTEATLPDGRVAHIESRTIAPGKEQAFANTIALSHRDAALIVHGLLMLRREGASYFGDEDKPPNLVHGYEYCDLSQKSQHILWMTLRAKNSSRRHLVGVLEWRDVNGADAVVTGIYVAKQFRSLGVATELMHKAVSCMKDADYSVALAFIPTGNDVASEFFASRDFQLTLRADEGEAELRVLDLEPPRLFCRYLDQGYLFE